MNNFCAVNFCSPFSRNGCALKDVLTDKAQIYQCTCTPGMDFGARKK